MLKTFLSEQQITQAQIVRDLGIDKATVSRLTNTPGINMTRRSIDRLLAYFTNRLGRPVTYEEAFGLAWLQRLSEGS